ncbi:MAG: MOSC domain-containing protein [Bacteroidota bacterium]
MSDVKHLTKEELEAGLDHILNSPKDEGTLEMIVIRPQEGERQVLEIGELDLDVGLKGDNWKTRGSKKTEDGSAHPEQQLNIMNARSAALVAVEKSRWPLAGDQLYIDINLSDENLPAGSQLSIGTAIVEITPIPHNGCKKFTQRFGIDAVKFVNSPVGKENHLRGVNAKVIQPGTIKAGDMVKKVK